jgi:hypothetical protein
VWALIITFIGAAYAAPPIAPLNVTLHWTAAGPVSQPVPVRLVDGTTAYLLWIEPEKDADGRIATLNLVLRSKAPGQNANLLAPAGNWHGYQLFMFGARDFFEGIDRSAYGATRNFVNIQRPLRVKATVSNVIVAPTGPNGILAYGFISLDLVVEIDNTPI